LLNYCMYADNLVMLAEDRLIADTVAKFDWESKAVPFDQFDARSVGNARNARESQVYRDQFLASIRDRRFGLYFPKDKSQHLTSTVSHRRRSGT
jgi:hypothetical protein